MKTDQQKRVSLNKKNISWKGLNDYLDNQLSDL